MDDRELLELAAKAAGYEIQDHTVLGDGLWIYGEGKSLSEEGRSIFFWSPLNDDADALRLMVKTNLEVERCAGGGRVYVGAYKEAKFMEEASYRQDIFHAMRIAIVRAAADIGSAMP